MLVLSRKRNESIKIGDDITITIVELRNDKARIGISAPKDMPVHREEIYNAIKAEGSDPLKSAKGEGKKARAKAASDQCQLPPRE